MSTTIRYHHQSLRDFAGSLLSACGMPEDKAEAVTHVLVEGELMGKVTHGLALLPTYLREIEAGRMKLDGEPGVSNDVGACLTWDGRMLPGAWLMLRAVDEAVARARRFGIGAVALQRGHHTGCLAVYLRRATEQGYALYLALTDPGHYSVAPFGGTTPVLTSNPLAFGAPTSGEPVLIDLSTSMVTNGMVGRMRAKGQKFDYPAMLDNQGLASNDPAVVAADPPGTILPLGGMDVGHKGYGISLMVELLSGCLTGHGRARHQDGTPSNCVFLLAFDPAAFGGTAAYLQEADWLVQSCRASATRPGFNKVSVPGDESAARRASNLANGIALDPMILSALLPFASKYAVASPAAANAAVNA